MKLFATMCNQPSRLAEALAPIKQTLVAPAPVSRWGFGYTSGGDVLLVRTPKSSERPIDLSGPLAEIATDCAIAVAVRDDREAATPASAKGTDNTPPFRFHRWMYAQTGAPAIADITSRLLHHVPEYLRRNVKGRTPGELVFHVFLAMLHDEGVVDEPNLAPAASQRALTATAKLVNHELEKIGKPGQSLGCVALSNGRSMVVARFDDEPLRLRRLSVNDDKGERDATFRGVILVSGETDDSFEDVPSSVMIARDLTFTLG